VGVNRVGLMLSEAVSSSVLDSSTRRDDEGRRRLVCGEFGLPLIDAKSENLMRLTAAVGTIRNDCAR
jgi:hypothetical protein